jgi:hypothetical protein
MENIEELKKRIAELEHQNKYYLEALKAIEALPVHGEGYHRAYDVLDIIHFGISKANWFSN